MSVSDTTLVQHRDKPNQKSVRVLHNPRLVCMEDHLFRKLVKLHIGSQYFEGLVCDSSHDFELHLWLFWKLILLL